MCAWIWSGIIHHGWWCAQRGVCDPASLPFTTPWCCVLPRGIRMVGDAFCTLLVGAPPALSQPREEKEEVSGGGHQWPDVLHWPCLSARGLVGRACCPQPWTSGKAKGPTHHCGEEVQRHHRHTDGVVLCVTSSSVAAVWKEESQGGCCCLLAGDVWPCQEVPQSGGLRVAWSCCGWCHPPALSSEGQQCTNPPQTTTQSIPGKALGRVCVVEVPPSKSFSLPLLCTTRECPMH